MDSVKLVSKFFGNEKARDLAWRLENGGYEGARKALAMEPG